MEALCFRNAGFDQPIVLQSSQRFPCVYQFRHDSPPALDASGMRCATSIGTCAVPQLSRRGQVSIRSVFSMADHRKPPSDRYLPSQAVQHDGWRGLLKSCRVSADSTSRFGVRLRTSIAALATATSVKVDCPSQVLLRKDRE